MLVTLKSGKSGGELPLEAGLTLERELQASYLPVMTLTKVSVRLSKNVVLSSRKMKTYLNLLDRVLTEGTERIDRTGTGTLSPFGAQMRYPLSEGFPAVTIEKLQFKSMAANYLVLR